MENMTNGPSENMDAKEHERLQEEMRKAFAMLSGKWKLEILWLLYGRVHRFGELKKAIPKITQHMLTAQLREMEADGLVAREVFAEVPPRVEYRLTPAALSLSPVIEALMTWCLQNRNLK